MRVTLYNLAPTDLVFSDQDGVGHGEEPHQRAILQVLQDLMLGLDVAAQGVS